MGHFRIDREITEHAVFAHPIALKIWIWCLSKATFRKRTIPIKVGKGDTLVTLKPGQFVFGRFKAEECLNIDGSAIYRWMQKFSTDEWGLINIEPNNQYSIVTICNWDKYQYNDDENEQPMNMIRTTDEQSLNTNKKVIEGIKRTNNNIYTPLFEKFWDSYSRKGSKSVAFKEWKIIKIETNEEMQSEMFSHLNRYIQATERNFLKDAERYLKTKYWEGK